MSLQEYPDDKTYLSHESKIRDFRDKVNIYQKMQEKKTNKTVHFLDGPPFVSGNLHHGHSMIFKKKSAQFKYFTMTGFHVVNMFGYDCHGFPVESKVEEKLDIKDKRDVKDISLFIKEGINFVNSVSDSWTPLFKLLGREGDFKKVYKTMDLNYMESEWWGFKESHKKDLIYKGFQIMPFSTKLGSPLSNFEASSNYKTHNSKTVFVLFELCNNNNTYFVAWTTTPWTLPSNVALCLNPKGNYVLVESDELKGKKFVVCENNVKNLKLKNVKITKFGTGTQLLGTTYKPVFPYLTDLPESKNFFKVLCDDFVEVNSKDGTGIVHIAPAFGADDFNVSIKNKLVTSQSVDKLCLVDDFGNYIPKVKQFEGLCVIDPKTNDEVIKQIKTQNLHYRTDSYEHQYPYCYRTNVPLIYKISACWFFKVTSIKDQIYANYQKTTWHPNQTKNRFEDWLNNLKDWGLSRKRLFGTPIPLWVSDDGTEIECIGSIDELVKRGELKERPNDIHLDVVSNITIKSTKGTILKHCGEVFDCWHNSACAPFAQLHYPFENKQEFDKREFLTDYVIEGIDQTRGWFYVLLVLSTALFNKPPYKHVVCTELIVDENGEKFSKKNKNYKDVQLDIAKYGSDTFGIYLLKSSASAGTSSLWYSENGLEITKLLLVPWINSVKFFTTHCTNFLKKNHKFDENLYKTSTSIYDKWIISKLGTILTYVRESMDNFDCIRAIDKLLNFIDDLTNWYVKLNRERLKGFYSVEEWSCSLSTMYKVLYDYCLMMAPFAPFLTEHMFQYLKTLVNCQVESVLLMDYPKVEDYKNFIDTVVETNFGNLIKIVHMVRTLRSSTKKFSSIKIPLKQVIISHSNQDFLTAIQKLVGLVETEINSLEFVFKKFTDSVDYFLQPNKKNMGTKYKKDANKFIKLMENLDKKQLEQSLVTNKISLNNEGKTIILDSNDYDLICNPKLNDSNIISKVDNGLLVGISTIYNQEIHYEHQLRKWIALVQDMRRKKELKPWNKIAVVYNCNNDEKYVFLDNLKDKKVIDRLKCIVTNNDIYQDKKIVISNIFESESFDNNIYPISTTIYSLD
jgi:isoleucyl-tRNA synthetase